MATVPAGTTWSGGLASGTRPPLGWWCEGGHSHLLLSCAGSSLDVPSSASRRLSPVSSVFTSGADEAGGHPLYQCVSSWPLDA